MTIKKKLIILFASVIILLASFIIYLSVNNRQSLIEPIIADDEFMPSIQIGDYVATVYPSDMSAEAVSGVLNSLNAYMENILDPDITMESFLDISHHNQILRLNITETSGEAVLVTKDNAENFTNERNPLRSTRQIVHYAANSGHTINDLSIIDEISTVGIKDFFAYLDSAKLVSGEDIVPDYYELTEDTRKEIIKYCADMLADNRDTELYILSDNVIAFVMCERYSDESLLGSFSFLEKEGDTYLPKIIIDFNC